MGRISNGFSAYVECSKCKKLYYIRAQRKMCPKCMLKKQQKQEREHKRKIKKEKENIFQNMLIMYDS